MCRRRAAPAGAHELRPLAPRRGPPREHVRECPSAREAEALGDEERARQTLEGIIQQVQEGKAVRTLSTERLASHLTELYERIAESAGRAGRHAKEGAESRWHPPTLTQVN